MTYMARRVQHYGTTIFSEMTALSIKHKSINLGQGFPNFAAPDFVKNAVKEALDKDINQYPPAIGRPRLRNAIAAKVAKHHGLIVDPATQIVAMHGATECIFSSIQSLVDPGDEVILFEPYYDSYVPSVEFAGGVPRYYTLRAPDWSIDPDALEALFSDKTKVIIINSPHNPSGKVFTREELQMIADLCHKYDVIAVSDEVYEHIIFDGVEHISIATLDGMAERTVMIASVGKTFSVTGWKVGWVVSSPELCTAIFRTHQWVTFAGAAPLEEATAASLEWADEVGYYDELGTLYQKKRDILIEGLSAAGFPVITPKGTYFTMVDISGLGFANDIEFCRYLTKEVGVTAIPPSAFYVNPADGANIARFAFCKTDEALLAASDVLKKAYS
ncbi:MAG: methionine aminotransferase [Candidatus Promineifilaceae bacterium]